MQKHVNTKQCLEVFGGILFVIYICVQYNEVSAAFRASSYRAASYSYRAYSYSYRAYSNSYRAYSNSYRAYSNSYSYYTYRTSYTYYSTLRYSRYSSVYLRAYFNPYYRYYYNLYPYYSSYYWMSRGYGVANDPDSGRCSNFDDINGTYMGYFSCPMSFEPNSFTDCCGEKDSEYCCEGSELDGGSIAGIIIGGLLFFALCIVLWFWFCSIIKRRGHGVSTKTVVTTNVSVIGGHRTVPHHPPPPPIEMGGYSTVVLPPGHAGGMRTTSQMPMPPPQYPNFAPNMAPMGGPNMAAMGGGWHDNRSMTPVDGDPGYPPASAPWPTPQGGFQPGSPYPGPPQQAPPYPTAGGFENYPPPPAYNSVYNAPNP